MKHRLVTRIDALKDIVLPPGATLHRSDGTQIDPKESAALVQRGEIVEIRQDGKRIARLRVPDENEEFTPKMLRTIGRMQEDAKRENYDSAVNWIDRAKDRFWCPICEKNQSHPVAFSCWATSEPECNLVCYYAICKRCAKEGERFQKNGDDAGFRRICDLAEQRLANRYPHIASNLRAAYFEGSAEEIPAPESAASAPVGHLMVPNPVQLPFAGEPLQITVRRHLVIRFLPGPEIADLDKQSAIIFHLGERYPLVSVCRNGEEPEGLEAWFKVEGWSEEKCRALMDYACTLGADPKTFDPLCRVHLPNAVNPLTGKEQKLIYFDPDGENFPDGPTPLVGHRPAP